MHIFYEIDGVLIKATEFDTQKLTVIKHQPIFHRMHLKIGNKMGYRHYHGCYRQASRQAWLELDEVKSTTAKIIIPLFVGQSISFTHRMYIEQYSFDRMKCSAMTTTQIHVHVD